MMNTMKSLDASFFANNRTRVMEKLKGGLLVVPGYAGMQRGNDAEFRFEQEANFWYLTGLEFADWWLIIDAARGKSWLVEPDIDEMHRLFEESLPVDTAKTISGIDEVMSRDQAMAMLRQLAKTHTLIHTVDQPPYHEHFRFTLNPAAHAMREMLGRIFKSVQDFRLELSRIRAIKQPLELELMQQVIDQTIVAFEFVKMSLPDYKYEYEIEADFSHAFRAKGGSGHAFDPIVASGASAAVVHHFSNNNPLKKATLVMMDIGMRLNGYASDITRTYAVGKPTKRQIAIHQVVQSAQQQIIELLEPGLAVETYHKQSDDIIKRALLDVKLISGMDDEKGFRLRFPHAISHGLGVDVHDPLGRPRTFQPGMVLTVEPGIYIPSEGIGVRIEDDILITENGHRNMSAKLSTEL